MREIPFSVGSQFRAEQVRGEVVLFLSFSSLLSFPSLHFCSGEGAGERVQVSHLEEGLSSGYEEHKEAESWLF